MESESGSTTIPMDDHRRQHQSPPSTTPPLFPKTDHNGFVGRHRLAASISHLHNQINFLQEELDQLDTLGESSIVCKELISNAESVPDPLLPLSKGPIDVNWDRWFRGANNNRKRWI
ncbi:guanine nucleotide-binding protein subunit gamma 1-like [Mercurialis annua]|uniref:guanine nucleotide-binding protein subunit gamma 1-like n=1 Tax=Mercurialis annua TaxID=3986 RepID=UPI002160F512|nr:guanine nucleotide-binding protein subunit gamma 1-like [Mercurialis annua]